MYACRVNIFSNLTHGQKDSVKYGHKDFPFRSAFTCHSRRVPTNLRLIQKIFSNNSTPGRPDLVSNEKFLSAKTGFYLGYLTRGVSPIVE